MTDPTVFRFEVELCWRFGQCRKFIEQFLTHPHFVRGHADDHTKQPDYIYCERCQAEKLCKDLGWVQENT